jgi:hypothetical protein
MAKKAPLNLTAIQQAAISKIVSADAYKTANGELQPGEYPIEMLVKITGKLKKGEKYEAPINWSIDWRGLFATALSKLNGVTVESVVTEYLNNADKGIDLEALKDQAQKAVDTIKGESVQVCNGKLTGTVTAEIVDTFGVEVK